MTIQEKREILINEYEQAKKRFYNLEGGVLLFNELKSEGMLKDAEEDELNGTETPTD